MNQIEIGKFIANERKNKNYTQKQLSELLNISDKTISKWECGNGFPEVSLLLPLCEELDISINELISAKKISDDNYKKKAEENIMSLIKEKEINKKNWKSMIITGCVSTISFITLVLIVSIYSDVIDLPAKIIISIIAVGIFSVGIYSAMENERTIGYYKCPNCGNSFVPSMNNYQMGAKFFGTRRLKCPNCGQKRYCKKVMSKND